jgi:hypothetical protein
VQGFDENKEMEGDETHRMAEGRSNAALSMFRLPSSSSMVMGGENKTSLPFASSSVATHDSSCTRTHVKLYLICHA